VKGALTPLSIFGGSGLLGFVFGGALVGFVSLLGSLIRLPPLIRLDRFEAVQAPEARLAAHLPALHRLIRVDPSMQEHPFTVPLPH
jgi:hypothetical protein